MYQLYAYVVCNVLDSKSSLLGLYLRVEGHLQKNVAKFLA